MNLLDDATNQTFKFRTKNRVEINDEPKVSEIIVTLYLKNL